MPLPSVLAEKLAKRGIITDKPRKVLEEVIAESYDIPVQKKKKVLPKQNEDDLLLANRGHEGCPNKYNVYHECTTFCVTLWKIGVLQPDQKYVCRKYKLLKQYPLPERWKEVFDRGCGRYYFWNTESDEVSWYPPLHPKAKITQSAAQIREAKSLIQIDEPAEIDTDSEDSESSEEEISNISVTRSKFLSRPKKNLDNNPLDPMDPASYSDVPRGTWSSGLDTHMDAKTGVDTTASGPLYQMRPYPSPGSILAANAKSKSKTMS